MTPKQTKKLDRMRDLLGDASAGLDDLENDATFSEEDRATFHDAWERVYEVVVMMERFRTT